MPDTFVATELASQPTVWRRVAAEAKDHVDALPHDGERVAVVGCGTSWFIAMAYARFREDAGHGVTDAFAASEYPIDREYDRIVAISRSGTTTEVLALLDALSGGTIPTTLITGVPGLTSGASRTIVLEYADERSVVQTRFATSALTLLRAALGEDLAAVFADGDTALAVDIAALLDAEQVTFVGRGPAIGLTFEAALKTREAAQFWAESYPAMDYRHGPISIAQPGRLVWSIGAAPAGLVDDVAATGATFVHFGLDPQAELVVAQRFAVALAAKRGLDVDNPRSLTRSVILQP
jgi:fructoselysine-6-P-deglycase FrlB-like protein